MTRRLHLFLPLVFVGLAFAQSKAAPHGPSHTPSPRAASERATVEFKNVRKFVWHHNLDSADPHITCRDPEGHKVETFDGWVIVDNNTAKIEFSEPTTAKCVARR